MSIHANEQASGNLAKILDVMEDGVYVIREDMTVEYMNRAMARDREPALGRRCHEAIFGRNAVCPWCRANEVFAGNEIRREHRIRDLGRTYDILEYPVRNPEGGLSKVSIYRDITQRKTRERTLRTSREDYTRLFEHVGVGVYISSKEGRFLNANQALLDMLGYASKEEFLKIDITEDLYLRALDRRKFQDMIERDGRVIDYEVEFKRKDGSPVPVLLTSHVRQDAQGMVLGYEGIIADQSHRKQMERELREAHHFLNMIVHNSPNAIMATNMKGDIILWNRSAEETLGYAAADVIGRMNIRAIYPEGMANHTQVQVPDLSETLCGSSRPGHFNGVTTVVTKLFNIVQPDVAVFGEKDYQQLSIVRKMVKDLCMPIRVVGVETARDEDGLAKSSRNGYLSEEQRRIAPVLHQTLVSCRDAIACGFDNFLQLESHARMKLLQAGFEPDYFAIRDARTLRAVTDETEEIAILTAARLGATRLIDNVRLATNPVSDWRMLAGG